MFKNSDIGSNYINTIDKKTHYTHKVISILEKKQIDSDYTISFNRESCPLNLEVLQKQYQELYLELGSGWGDFTIDLARNIPDACIVAIEQKSNRIKSAIKKQQQEKLHNIRWMLINIDWFFKGLFVPNLFYKIIINFPDPWPKKKHTKHRFFSESFLNELSLISKQGCVLEFATDYWPYLENTLNLLEQHPNWVNYHGNKIVLDYMKKRPKSYFEKKNKKEGNNCYFLQFIKQ